MLVLCKARERCWYCVRPGNDAGTVCRVEVAHKEFVVFCECRRMAAHQAVTNLQSM